VGHILRRVRRANHLPNCAPARLRGLVAKRGRDSNLPSWQHENLLFICTTRDYQRFTFAHFRGEDANRAILATFGWEKGDTHIRTLCEFNLNALKWPDDPTNVDHWSDGWRAAFDVEAVTEKFFDGYHTVFESVEGEASKSIRNSEACRLYTQRLFNRLMFIYFIQKKGWLSFDGDWKYLRALFSKAEAEGENFLRDRLYWLFFYGMSNVGESREIHEKDELRRLRGDVPYLNGGLFDMEDDYDERERVKLSNLVFGQVFDLFERYNFTVAESTPLDVQVAVDPEMLGKVFEELVTGRHESGSYYTPRPVVSFMCREALKKHLASSEPERLALECFVDDGDASQLKDPESVLDALKCVRICDPACGSGAYLLGMMHELLCLRAALFKSSQIDDESVYRRKREIIERNLFGVDKDRFAVQIACLRLWLSLAIESDKPQPLPNLDFKIECGDSLTGPAPNADDLQLDLNRTLLVRKYQESKSEFLTCENSQRKRKLRDEIEDLQAQIALSMDHQPQPPSAEKLAIAHQQENQIKRELRQAEAEKNHAKAAGLQKKLQAIKKTIAEWGAFNEAPKPGFDWVVEFAEVFAPRASDGTRLDGGSSFLNEVDRQPMFTDKTASNEQGGFDIVLANPPYVRADAQFKHIKDADVREASITAWKQYRESLLKSGFYKTIYEKWDLYLPFLERAYQLLRNRGQMVFIISDAYNAAKYASRSHQFFLRNTLIERIDFCTEIPLFKAGVNNSIVHFAKLEDNTTHIPIRVRRYGESRDDFETNSEILISGPQRELGPGVFKPDLMRAADDNPGCVVLGQLCYVSYGLAASSDEVRHKGEFVTADVVSDIQDKKHPKRYVEGKDVAKWWITRERYLEWGTARAPRKFRRQTFVELHEAKQKLIALVVASDAPPVAYDDRQRFTTHTSCIFVPWHQLTGVRNKSIKKTAKYHNEIKEGETRPPYLREELEELSQKFLPKYILAVMNSTFTKIWLASKRRSKLHVYPDDWKRLPIVSTTLEHQQEFVSLVNKILGEFEKNGYPLPADATHRVQELERNIDERVVALYAAQPAPAEEDAAFPAEATSRPLA
jgi:hypothetical protein